MQILTSRNAGALNNAPIAKAIFDPKEAVSRFDDFFSQAASADTNLYNITIGSSTTVVHSATVSTGVWTLTSTSGADVQVNSWTPTVTLAGNRTVFFEAVVAVDTIASSGSAFIGLGSAVGSGTTPATCITTAGAMDGSASGVGFTITAATIRGVCGKAADIGTPVVITTAATAATYYRLGFRVEGLTKVTYFLNGVQIGTIETVAAIPTAVLFLDLAVKAATAAKALSIDNLLLAYDR
jgi:hypothetical protein